MNGLAGDWLTLDSPTDLPRYQTIARALEKYLSERARNGLMLDVGCGEAVLKRHLPEDVTYVGVEPSTIAARQAEIRGARVYAESADQFLSRIHSLRFDAIVFSESLYYTRNPVGLLQAYRRLLAPGGIVVVTIYLKPEASLTMVQKLWRLWLRADRRRPVSNLHCAGLVEHCFTGPGWRVLEDTVVPIPGSSSEWRVWVATGLDRE